MNNRSWLKPSIFACYFAFVYEHLFIPVATINRINCCFKSLYSFYVYWHDF
ncbi:hypothetical protein MBAV_005095 [Candidatus Magnetobacterium bavaricum]|uniref:Uncharacterized protein n=1 Tax=Candidatus Magnetobacterium bavaricum TaxID=29290 RepID=A0A0F3GLD9_9BACT|nr:hypothetical protein MBAV_005095 [Candidatus Magnetobacterium bavaricum]